MPAKKKKIGLLPHEARLLQDGWLEETTHPNASSRWLGLPAARQNVEAVMTSREGLRWSVVEEEGRRAAEREALDCGRDDKLCAACVARGAEEAPEAELAATEDEDGEAIAPAADPAQFQLVYRHMCDAEFSVLRETGLLPSTQPYQTIVCGDSGFGYCMKYFTEKKKYIGQKDDSSDKKSTFVVFAVESTLVDSLFAMQSKAEDGVLSHGLGDKGGKGLPVFNAALLEGRIRWAVRLVKRG